MGGFAGYKIGIKHTSEQKQVADDSSKQRQELYIDEKSKTDFCNGFIQQD